MKPETNQTTAKHTPGPWLVDKNSTLLLITADYIPDGIICEITPPDTQSDGGRNREVENANARLIAAAPELLANLIELVNAEKASRDSFNGKSIARIEAALAHADSAIAKAEGRA